MSIEMKSLEDSLREAFELFDEDSDGEITLEELGRIMVRHGYTPSLEELQSMIGRVDMNRQAAHCEAIFKCCHHVFSGTAK